MEFKRLADVETVETASDESHVLIEEAGEIKKVPKTEVGGAGGGIPTAIIKSSDYDNALAGVQTMMAEADPVTWACINMTFEEAYEIMASGGVLNVVFMLVAEGCMNVTGIVGFAGTMLGEPAIMLIETNMNVMLIWSAEGITVGGK